MKKLAIATLVVFGLAAPALAAGAKFYVEMDTVGNCSVVDSKPSAHSGIQASKYGPIATPYCEEDQIANVANSYGWRVSAAEVHNNPLTKVYLCQTIGYDWRLQAACAGYLPHGGGAR
jgi:hypothetical protein